MGLKGSLVKPGSDPVQIERLVIGLVNRLLDVGRAEIDDALNDTLARMGAACDLDRCFLFRIRPDGTHYNSHEWVAPGVVALKDRMQAFDPTGHAIWHGALLAGQTVAVSSRSDLPEGAAERLFMESIGVHSTLMLPMREGGRLLGVIGFDSARPDRTWGEDEVFLLSSIGRAVASILMRIEAAAEAEASRVHLEATLRALPDLVIEIGPDRQVIACHSDNLPWLSRLVHAGRGRHVSEVLPEALAQALVEMMQAPPASGTARLRRVGVKTLVAPHWYEVSVAPLASDPAHCDAGVVAVIRDLSATQTSSEMASWREGQFTAFFEMCPHPILLNDFDTGELLDGNRAFKQVFGIDPQKEPRLGVRDITPTDAAWVIDHAVASLQATGSYGPVEALLRRADDSRFPAVLRGFMSIDPNGRRLVWALIEDVTEIKAKRTALMTERSELEATRARLVSAIEALDDGFAIFDADDRLVLWNTPYTRVFAGLSDLLVEGALYDDLLRAAIDRGIFGAEGERDEDSLTRRLHRPLTEIWDGEDAFADGRLIWVRERATPERETVGLYEDVTARRLADRRLQQVVEGGEIAVWEWSAESGLSAMNDRWRAMLGREDGLSDLPDLKTLIHHQDLPAAQNLYRALFQQGVADFDLLCRMRHAAGHWVWLLSRGKVVARRGDGTPRRISGVTLDVSARIEAEQRLARLIDGARVGTWEYDERQQVTVVNDRWADILGYRAAELNPLPRDRWLEMIHPDDRQEMLGKSSRALGAGEWTIELEIRLRHREGHWVWVLSRGQVTEWDTTGRPLQVSGVHLDITAAKDLEAALARERDTLARIMETSVSGIIAVDGSGRVVFANGAAEAVLGRPIAPGDDLPQILAAASLSDPHRSWGDPHDMPLNRALAGQGVQHDQRQAIIWPDGTRRVLSVNAARLSAPGTGLAVVCSMTDITDAVESEDRLRAAMTAAETANRAKSDFLAAISHEMRTPLNGVLGMVEVLGARVTDAEQQSMLQIIRQSGEHLLAVINDILDLAKIESGRFSLDPTPLNLCDVVENILTLHRVQAAEKGIGLRVECLGSKRDAHRFGDEKRLVQILHNLLGNAIKFTDAGEVVVRVDATSPARVVLEVSDTGIGMSEAEIARVFEEFTQGQGGIARRYGGTGLGLAIVRRLARMMRGDVSLTGAPGQGLVARVQLEMPVLSGRATSADTGSVPLPPPMTVLAAEDNATNRIILGSLLERLGITAEITASGDEALERWQPGRYDVVLLDIAMPGRDGLSTLAALKAKAAGLGVDPPLAVAVTANAMTHQVEEYLWQGFAACVAKPLRPEHLAEALLACHARISERSPGSAPFAAGPLTPV